jgi:hypothetical protein
MISIDQGYDLSPERGDAPDREPPNRLGRLGAELVRFPLKADVSALSPHDVRTARPRPINQEGPGEPADGFAALGTADGGGPQRAHTRARYRLGLTGLRERARTWFTATDQGFVRYRTESRSLLSHHLGP